MRRLLVFTVVAIYSALLSPSFARAAEGGPDSLDARLTELITHPYRHGLPRRSPVLRRACGAPLKQHLKNLASRFRPRC
jgi:hypothetical protein